MISKSLKSVIQEELQKFINEAPDHTDDEMVDKSNIDLQYEYDKINRELFDGSLPRITLKWNRSDTKRKLGSVHSRYDRYTGERKIKFLGMTGYYKITYRNFKNTLAHEMIHVKQVIFGNGGDHGPSFYSEMRRINGLGLEYTIDVRSSEPLEVSDEIKGRSLIAMIFSIDGSYFVCATTPAVYAAEGQFFFDYYERIVNRGQARDVEITVVESQNPQLMKLRIVRTFKRGFSYGRLPDKLLEELLSDKIIKSVRFRKGVPAQISEDENSGDWIDVEIS